MLGACGHDVGYRAYDILQGQVLGLDLLGYDAYVGLCLEGAFEGDVRGRAAHELDEVPVFLGREAVALYVADKLGVDFGGGVEAERRLDDLVLEVAVDGLRAADHLHSGADALVVLGEHGCVGIGVVAADDHESLDAELLEDLKTLVELLFLLKFGAA